MTPKLVVARDVGEVTAARGVVTLVHCFMPEQRVMGGEMARAGDLLLDFGAYALWHDSTPPPSPHMPPSPTAPARGQGHP